MSEKLLSAREAANRLRVGYSTMLDFIHKGEVAVVRLPGRRSYLIDPRDLDALIDASKSAPIPAPSKEVDAKETQENPALPEQRRIVGDVYKKGWHEQLTRK